MGLVSNAVVVVVVRGGAAAQRDEVLARLRGSSLLREGDREGEAGADVVLHLGTASELASVCGGSGPVAVGVVTDEVDPQALTTLLDRGFFDVLHVSETQAARLERTIVRAAASGRARGASPTGAASHNRFLETIIDAAPIGIAYWDKELRYQRVNATLAAMNGLPVEAHYGRTLSQVLPGIPEEATAAMQEVLRTGIPLTREVSGTTPAQPDVERAWLVNFYPVRAAGAVEGVAAICEETTERKNGDKERERFIAVLGHDLRNPLSAVLMSAQLLRARVGDKEKVVVDRVKRSALRMQRMIRDLLDFARLRQGGGLQLRTTAGDLVELLRDVVVELKQANPAAEVEVEAPKSLQGNWDLERLAQVASNLIGNAIMHGTPGALVRVELSEAPGDQVRLEVKNQGEPPNADHLEQLFQPFRAGRGEGNRDSLGLGLFIARALAEAHGGRVTLRAGQGVTTANVTLPRNTGARTALS